MISTLTFLKKDEAGVKPVMRLSQWVVKFKTSNQEEGSWELLSEENLEELGIKREDIIRIEPFFEVPGVLYTEPGVASETHPTGGSIGVWIYTKDSNRTSIQDIIYYDFNVRKTHYNGLPHWNHERRFINKEGKEKRLKNDIEWHIIKDSDWISIVFNDQKKTITKKTSIKT
jgi:hypothetical protein